MDDRVARLSKSQRDCLRLVAAGMSSKEIAQQLHFTHNTVDRYIFTARNELGAAHRREAARWVVDWEQKNGLQNLVYQSQPIANTGYSATLTNDPDTPDRMPQTEDLGRQSEDLGLSLDVSDPDRSEPGAFLIFGGRPNDLSPHQRVKALLATAFLAVVTLLAIVLIAEGALSLYN